MTLTDWIIGIIAVLAFWIAALTRSEFLTYLVRIGFIKSKEERKAEIRKKIWENWGGGGK